MILIHKETAKIILLHYMYNDSIHVLVDDDRSIMTVVGALYNYELVGIL